MHPNRGRCNNLHHSVNSWWFMDDSSRAGACHSVDTTHCHLVAGAAGMRTARFCEFTNTTLSNWEANKIMMSWSSPQQRCETLHTTPRTLWLNGSGWDDGGAENHDWCEVRPFACAVPFCSFSEFLNLRFARGGAPRYTWKKKDNKFCCPSSTKGEYY